MKVNMVIIITWVLCTLIIEIMSTTIREVNIKSHEVNYEQVNETVFQKNHVIKKPIFRKYQTRKSKRDVMTEPSTSTNKIKPIASPPLEGYDERVDTERKRDLEIADDYMPYYEDSINIPGDNDITENGFGYGNKRSKAIELTRVEGLVNGKPRKHLDIVGIPSHVTSERATESDPDFKVLKLPKLSSSTLTHSPFTPDYADTVSNNKMLQDKYTKRDYIVQQRIHTSNGKEILARKVLAFLKPVRDRDNKNKEAKPVYEEVLSLESFNKPESSDTKNNPRNIINTETGSEVEMYKETSDIKELQEDVFYGEGFGGFDKSFGGNRRSLIVRSQLTEHVYLPHQLSPRELKTKYCDDLPNGNYPNPGLDADVDTRCSYITCSNKHTYLFHCPQGSWNGNDLNTYHGGEAPSNTMTWKRGEVTYIGPSNSNVFCHVNDENAIEVCNNQVPAEH